MPSLIPCKFLSVSANRVLILFIGLTIALAGQMPARANSQARTYGETAVGQNDPALQKTSAERALAEGKQLEDRGTPEAWQQAIEKYKQAQQLYQVLADRAGEAQALHNIGRIYFKLGDNQSSLDYTNQALPLWQAAKDRAGETTSLNNLGLVYSKLGERQKALDFLNRALSLSQEVADRLAEARALRNIADIYYDLGEWQKALEFYNRGLLGWRSLQDKNREGETLRSLGNIYNKLGDKLKALDFYNQSILIWRSLGDRTEEADTLQNIGLVYNESNDQQKALDTFNQVLSIRRATGERNYEAAALNLIGSTYEKLNETPKALDFYNQALQVSDSVGNRLEAARALQNIGEINAKLGETQKALDYYNRALPIFQEVRDRQSEGFIMLDIGKIYFNLGDKQKASDNYNRALEIFKALGNSEFVSFVYTLIGKLDANESDKQNPLDAYNQALASARAAGDRHKEASVLQILGLLYLQNSAYQKAIDTLNQAVPIFRALGDARGEALTLQSIGTSYLFLKEKPKALAPLNQALPLFRVAEDVSGEALTLSNIGLIYLQLDDDQKGLDFLNQALPIYRTIGDNSAQAYTLYNIAVADRNFGNLAKAKTEIEEAIAIIESLRTKVIGQQLRTSYFASKQNYYEFYIDLLMQLHKQNPASGYDALALQVSERARARSLLEILTESNADIRSGVDPQLLQRERTLQQKFDDLEKERFDLFSSQYTESQVADFKQKTEKLLAESQEIQERIRATSPRYAALTQPQPLSLAQLQQQVFDDNTILLEYFLGENRSYLWAVTKTGIASYELPKRDDIEEVAKRFRQALTAPAQRNNPQLIAKVAADLSQMILQPVASQLGQKRLLIVSDGALQYIPFAALSEPGKASAEMVPMVVEHEIVNLPSASTLAVLRSELRDRKQAPKAVAVLADPVFSNDDERVKGKTPNNAALPPESQQLQRAALEEGISWTRLPFTRTEAERILALVPEGDRSEQFDFTANRASATSEKLSQYRIVHFATHGFADSANPELSGIVLSLVDEKGSLQNGYLRLHDIYNLNLPAELVVLSACQTGLGKAIKGEGLIGLTRGFMYAGAPRVVVSLWSVNDKATSELMVIFYQKMLKDSLAPAAALRAAQVDLLQKTEWKSPYYWAAFGLQGEWK